MNSTFTTEKFIERARKVHGDKYGYSEATYTKAKDKVKIICPEHGTFVQTPDCHLRGKGCPYCSGRIVTTSSFIKKGLEVHKGYYDYSCTIYTNAYSKIIVGCPEHGTFRQLPGNHIKGAGCPKCGQKRTANKLSIGLEEFIKRSKVVHGDKYDYSAVIYKDNKTKVKIKCSKHGYFEKSPQNHILKKEICPKCSNESISFTTEKFKELAIKVHGETFDYSEVYYKNSRTKVKIICPEHGEFYQKPLSHARDGHGCPSCSLGTLGIEGFIERSKELHGNRYDYSDTTYVNTKSMVRIRCRVHGIFEISPETHLRRKQGCPECRAIQLYRVANSHNSKFWFGKIISKDLFILRARSIHADKYSYKFIKYVSYSTPINLYCSKHRSFFSVLPSKHIQREQGCPKCSLEYLSNKFSHDTKDFIIRAKKLHYNRYTYDKVDYVNMHTPITVTCGKHGDFILKASDHIWGMSGCPQCRMSKGELKIKSVLENLGICFIRQKKFSACLFIKELPFDFYLPDYSMCIEYDGSQHFKAVPYWGGEDKLEETQRNDNIKKRYCKEKGILLLRIPYWDFNNIEEILSKHLL